MERVTFDEASTTDFSDGTIRQSLADPLESTRVALNRYRIPPGAGLPGGLHAHMDQEEMFVVLSSEAPFETLDGEVVVGPEVAIRFAPGEYQSGRNDAEDDLVVLALGAPSDTDATRIPFPCPACGSVGLRLEAGGDRLGFRCPDCGIEHLPAPCPACGSEAPGARWTATRTGGRLPGMWATYEVPPVAD